MVRKIGSLKGKTKRKEGFVELGNDIVLPVRNLSITEDKNITLKSMLHIPKKVRPATQEEKDTLTQHDPTYNAKTYPMICEYNVDSPEYQEFMERRDKLQQLLNVIKYIDMDYEIEEGITLWDDIGVEKGNWDSACEYFGDVMCLSEQDLSDIFVEVKRIQGESVFAQLDKLKKLSDKSVFEILRLIEKVEIQEHIEENFIKATTEA